MKKVLMLVSIVLLSACGEKTVNGNEVAVQGRDIISKETGKPFSGKVLDYNNGRVTAEYEVSKGKLRNLINYQSNGDIMLEEKFDSDGYKKLSKTYHSAGVPSRYEEYKGGHLHGKRVWYEMDGKTPFLKGNYKDGKPHGRYEFNDGDKCVIDAEYKDGKLLEGKVKVQDHNFSTTTQIKRNSPNSGTMKIYNRDGKYVWSATKNEDGGMVFDVANDGTMPDNIQDSFTVFMRKDYENLNCNNYNTDSLLFRLR